ncbi:hypothetical protein BH10CHL1_BH10CHL1_42010 [soil metagenome]
MTSDATVRLAVQEGNDWAMDNEFKYLFWTEIHKLLTVLIRWVAAKQARAAQAYLPQVQRVWYEQAVTNGTLHDIATVARELGEEPTVTAKGRGQYEWRVGEVIVYVDDDSDYLTVYMGEQLVCSTQPQVRLFIPGHWLHILTPYIERAHAHDQAWQTVQIQWDYSADMKTTR